ncbi:MAG: Hint domain-containing protein [Dysgonomonas sp.]|nr:Hint domain-containing protein [Dysgonomonas sp.]
MKIKIFFLVLASFLFINISLNAQSMLSEGTQITMASDSIKNIETIAVGDKVLAYNLKERVYEEIPVKEIKKVMVNRLIRVTLKNGVQLSMSVDQPILGEKGWVSVDPPITAENDKYTDVKRCEIGDFVFLYNVTSTDYTEVTVIQGILEPTTMYSLELDAEGAYIANGFLVGQN